MNISSLPVPKVNDSKKHRLILADMVNVSKLEKVKVARPLNKHGVKSYRKTVTLIDKREGKR